MGFFSFTSQRIVFVALAYVAACSLSFGQQVPKAMNYQAVVRNNAGGALANQQVRLRFSILNGGPAGNLLYSENHLTNTDGQGLVTVNIGQGAAESGSFAGIAWGQTTPFVRVEVDPVGGTTYKDLGTFQLLSVPYALYAETAGNSTITRLDDIGNVNAANPSSGQSLVFDGTNWVAGPAPGDNWGSQTVQTTPLLTGDGTAASPLGISNAGATLGQTLKWNGTTWAPANDDISFAGGPLAVSPRISGNGSAGSPLDLAGQGATSGQVLAWNGTSWAPVTPAVSPTYTAQLPVTLTGTTIGLQSGQSNGQVLKWNGLSWAAGVDEVGSLNLTAGNGISIANGTISNTVWSVVGTNAFRTDGFVGIGTAAPTARLTLADNTSLTQATLRLVENEADFSRIQFANTVSPHNWVLGGRPESANAAGRFNFYSSQLNDDVVSLTSLGQVGIGTADPVPDTRLDVLGLTKYAAYFTTDFQSDDATVVAGIYTGGAFDAAGVYGESTPSLGKGFGVYGFANNIGVYGLGNGQTFNGNYAIIGVYGESTDNPSQPAAGSRIGTYGFAKGGILSIGVYGSTNNTGTDNYAGYFEGRLRVVGNLLKSAGTFEIDHPLDPANKYLYHSFVESPDMMNIYSGNVTTDATGRAVITLPAWFDTLNTDVRYQLTPVGQLAQAYVAREVKDNQFEIQSDKPFARFSWQLTATRNDPYARAHRVQVEVEKQAHEKGRYLHPELYGQPRELRVGNTLVGQEPVKRERLVRSAALNGSQPRP